MPATAVQEEDVLGWLSFIANPEIWTAGNVGIEPCPVSVKLFWNVEAGATSAPPLFLTVPVNVIVEPTVSVPFVTILVATKSGEVLVHPDDDTALVTGDCVERPSAAIALT